MSALDSPVHLTRGPRKRSVVACQLCRQRKVRCNVFMSGPPCINCLQDGLDCQVISRRNQKPDSVSALQPCPAIWSPQTPASGSMHGNPTDNHSPATLISSMSAPLQPAPDEMTCRDNAAAFSAAIVSDKPGTNPTPYYLGEKQGIAFLLDVCKPNGGSSSRGSHFLVPKAVINSQQPEDLAYLWAKGAFSIPSEEVCGSLLQCYFRHVHPFLPIIDVTNFINQYDNGGPRRISALLLWSMFSVASNFVEHATTQLAGYSSHKEMKRSMYQRAKVQDKLVLIQSVILMAFWYSDTDDRTGSWHWIGVAISLCQALGLNRSPDMSKLNWHISGVQRRLWRRIWWTCLLRDRWISFVIGRPLRINLEDCDIPMPSVEDVLSELRDISTIERKKYSISDSSELAECWVNLVKLSIALGKILTLNSNQDGVFPVAAEVEVCHKDILNCLGTGKKSVEKRPQIVEFHLHQFQLHYEAVIIALYRPYLLNDIVNNPSANEEEWLSTARRRVRHATASTHSFLDNIVAMNMIQYLGPMTLTVLVPTMHIHLLALRSPNLLTRRLGLHKLDFCMTIMADLGSTYWSAGIIYKLFKEAMDRLTGEYGHMPSQPDSGRQPSPEDMTATVSGDDIMNMNSNTPGILNSYELIREGANQRLVFSYDLWIYT
ncbi:fungal-specific transcription factor domain-containing protein [Xylogone sp. PMI_703]|nr:fungal-specific transcription factor domain-containing protein [Xylogone sp. PMI_703]